jgi:hypothetical protein
MEVSELVRREVRARFVPADVADAERLLEATHIPFLEGPREQRGRDRVHLAILKLAAGNFEKFARHLALAATDWRDLLVAAELADEDWPEVLRTAGFPVP